VPVNYSANLGIALNNIYLTCMILFTVGITYNHMQLISHEYPLDCYKGDMLDKPPLWRRGERPYSLESEPARINAHPTSCNILIAPLSRAFGVTLELYCAVAGLFILGCRAIFFYLCRKKSGKKFASSYEYLVTQWRRCILRYLPLRKILAAFLAHKCYLKIFLSAPHRQDLRRKSLVTFFDINAPLLLLKLNYIWIFRAFSTLIISLSLGKHLGNYLAYFFQLISPFYLWGFSRLSQECLSDKGRRISEVRQRYVELIQNRIKNLEFDVLLIDAYRSLPNSMQVSATDTNPLLKDYYKRTDQPLSL